MAKEKKSLSVPTYGVKEGKQQVVKVKDVEKVVNFALKKAKARIAEADVVLLKALDAIELPRRHLVAARVYKQRQQTIKAIKKFLKQKFEI